jgi:hypothetical protein
MKRRFFNLSLRGLIDPKQPTALLRPRRTIFGAASRPAILRGGSG